MQKNTKIILGIDPGTIIMGYGLVKVQGSTISLLEMGVLQPGKVKDSYQKLQLIFNTVSGLITKYQPDSFAIEAPFFGKNVQSMLKLGRAQGGVRAGSEGRLVGRPAAADTAVRVLVDGYFTPIFFFRNAIVFGHPSLVAARLAASSA